MSKHNMNMDTVKDKINGHLLQVYVGNVALCPTMTTSEVSTINLVIYF